MTDDDLLTFRYPRSMAEIDPALRGGWCEGFDEHGRPRRRNDTRSLLIGVIWTVAALVSVAAIAAWRAM